ncbi:MAG: hypothetical protein LBB56_00285 [Chitinispirillales bacterium]|jgi:transcriptional regulator with XRE-family HTH domain|nr:hypothetical protein [Chitinispirillales bacterium]
MAEIKDRIAELIETRDGGSKTRFAKKIGIKNGNTGLVHKWLSGAAKPKMEYQQSICAAYNVSINWLNNQEETAAVTPDSTIKRQYNEQISIVGQVSADRLVGLMESMQHNHERGQKISLTLAESVEREQKISLTLTDTTAKLADTNAKLGSWIERNQKTG